MAPAALEPVQSEREPKMQEHIDIITYQPFLGWSFIQWWNTSLLWQGFNQGLVDLTRHILGRRYVSGWRYSLDPYVHKREIHHPSKVDTTPPPTRLPDFSYQPLPSAKHVRLVHLLHGTKDSPLNVQFVTVELTKAPSFETLSYVWGVKCHRRVSCEGASLIARQNLYDALQALRSTDKPRIFWIDALCIDQNNLEERAQQVKMMREIFASSQRTIVWLGTKNTASPEIIALLRRLVDLPNSPETQTFDANESIWKQLGDLYANPWFYRIWIIQEVVVSKGIVIMLNQSEVWEWDLFATASRVALHQLKAWQTVFDPSIVVRLDGIRTEYLRDGPCARILRALSYGRSALATLDLDKIYAVSGLSEETFKVDYKESTIDSYIRLAAHIIAHPDGLALLDHVEDHAFRLHIDLPSWVPDWEVRHGPRLLRASPYSGAWNASLGATAHAQLSTNRRRLAVRGFVVDTLHHIGDLFVEQVPISGGARSSPQSAFHGRFLEFRKPFFQIWTMRRAKQWYSLAMKYAKLYGSTDERYKAYLYTITAGYSAIGADSLALLQRSDTLWRKVWLDAAMNSFSIALSAYGQHAPQDMSEAMAFMQMHVEAAWDRRFFTSRGHGIMGLCPALARKGDILVIINGVSTPCVLRKHRKGRFRFVGQCYAHGLMHGEAKDIVDLHEIRQFELV